MRASVYNTESFPTSPRTAEGRTYTAASTTAIHAAVQESAANNAFTAIVQPDVPRKLSASFAAGWQGGDIFIVGLDANRRYQVETIADSAGSTVNGTKVFSEITSITKETVAGTTDTVTIGVLAANFYSSRWDVIGAAGCSIEIQTTGTLTGTWTLWRANRLNPDLEDDDHWVQELAFLTAPEYVNPAAGVTHWQTEMNGGHATYWRLKYAPTSGAGDLYAWVTSEAS